MKTENAGWKSTKKDAITSKKIIKNKNTEPSIFCLSLAPVLINTTKTTRLENKYKNISQQDAHWYTINAIALHPKGHLIATGSRDKTVKIWDAQTFKLLKVLDTLRDGCHVNSVNALLWLDNGILVSGSDDRTLILWGSDVF